MALACAPKLNPRTKHIAVKYHFFREHVVADAIHIQWVESALQKADILTKGLTADMFIQIWMLLLGW